MMKYVICYDFDSGDDYGISLICNSAQEAMKYISQDTENRLWLLAIPDHIKSTQYLCKVFRHTLMGCHFRGLAVMPEAPISKKVAAWATDLYVPLNWTSNNALGWHRTKELSAPVKIPHNQ